VKVVENGELKFIYRVVLSEPDTVDRILVVTFVVLTVTAHTKLHPNWSMVAVGARG